MWSLKRLSSVMPILLMGIFEFKLPCSLCQLYRRSQTGNSAAR